MPIATTNPTTGRVEQTFQPLDAAEIEERLDRAYTAADELRQTAFATRARWMNTAADLMEREVEGTAAILTNEMGKTIAQSRAEVLKCATAMRYYAENAERFLADTVLDDPARVGASAAWTRYEPLGVILAVMPWNYPLWQVVRFAAPALMAGNAGLLKHASNVPQVALYLDAFFERSGFPAGAFQALLIDAQQTESVVRDRRVAAVTLTGSEPAGRSIAKIAGSEVKKAILELGGSDPFIVMPSANIPEAVATGVTARVNNNGQSCIAAKRFIIHADIYEEFVSQFVAKTAALRVGDPFDPRTDIGPIATESGRRELLDLVQDAIEAGAKVSVGGRALAGEGWFFEPTVIEYVTDSMRLYREEAFGPIATVYKVQTAKEALALANATSFGLGSAVWTNDQEETEWFIASLRAGAVFINGMTISYPELPFGGIKNSGIGRELAAEGIRELSNLKTVWRR